MDTSAAPPSISVEFDGVDAATRSRVEAFVRDELRHLAQRCVRDTSTTRETDTAADAHPAAAAEADTAPADPEESGGDAMDSGSSAGCGTESESESGASTPTSARASSPSPGPQAAARAAGPGRVQYFGGFCIDTTTTAATAEGTGPTPAGWADGPSYKAALVRPVHVGDHADLGEVDPSRMCFNCGGDHRLADCPWDLDAELVAQRRAEFQARRPKHTGRFYAAGALGEQSKPGQILAVTRAALGMEDGMPPPWVYRMRQLGYPPAWTPEAYAAFWQSESDAPVYFDHDMDRPAVGAAGNGGSSTTVGAGLDANEPVLFPGFNAPWTQPPPPSSTPPAAEPVPSPPPLETSSSGMDVDNTQDTGAPIVLAEPEAPPGPAAQQPPEDVVNEFFKAARSGRSTVLKPLLGSWPGLPLAKNTVGLTALHIASGRGHYLIAAALLKSGAAVNEASLKGNTALHMCSAKGHHLLARLLLQHGADPSLRNSVGERPLDMARGVSAILVETLESATPP